MLNEKCTFSFKITIKWNLAKSHATRLRSAKYKTRDKRTNIQMNYLQQVESVSRLII